MCACYLIEISYLSRAHKNSPNIHIINRFRRQCFTGLHFQKAYTNWGTSPNPFHYILFNFDQLCEKKTLFQFDNVKKDGQFLRNTTHFLPRRGTADADDGAASTKISSNSSKLPNIVKPGNIIHK